MKITISLETDFWKINTIFTLKLNNMRLHHKLGFSFSTSIVTGVTCVANYAANVSAYHGSVVSQYVYDVYTLIIIHCGYIYYKCSCELLNINKCECSHLASVH